MHKKREKIPDKTEVMVDQIRPIRILPWNASGTSMYIGVTATKDAVTPI